MKGLRLFAGFMFLVFWSVNLVEAAPSVTNVRGSQQADGSVRVYYDLSGGQGSMTVNVLFSNDNGQNWDIVPGAGYLSGDVGSGETNGTNKLIIWDAENDRPNVYWAQTKAKVTATEASSDGSTITISLPGGVTMDMVRIPAGSFQMGSNDDSTWLWCGPCEQPVHTVNIGYDFYMGKFEVTQAQWLSVMGDWPGTGPRSDYGAGNNYPAYNISWNDCQNFITELNKLGQGTFRLPSEAEWEYACRAGTTTRFYFGDSDCAPTGTSSCELDDYAWWGGNNGSSGTADYGSKEVGQKLPNDFGLYDMHGNLWEWCQDYWHDDYTGAPTDGSSWESPSSSYRVLRGGSWFPDAKDCRSSLRYVNTPDPRNDDFGVRLLRTP